MTGLMDITVLRLPKGIRSRALDASPMEGFGGAMPGSDGGAFHTATRTRKRGSELDDIFAPARTGTRGGGTRDALRRDVERKTEAVSGMKLERLRVTDRERRMLEAEEGTFGAVQTMFYNHVQPVSMPAGATAGAHETHAWGREAIGLTKDTTRKGTGVTVAVLDTGLDRTYKTHPAFAAIADRIEGKNFIGEDAQDWADHGGHGTHVAGTIFGQPVGGVEIGVAPGIERALIGRVLGPRGGSTQSIYQGMIWAVEEGADVISMSLAIDFDNMRRYQVDTLGRSEAEATSLTLKAYRENFTLFDRLSAVFDVRSTRVKSPVVVVATGNESARPDYTIEASPPAVSEGFISVNAVDAEMKVADFSNTMGTLSAPGVGILSAALGGGLRLDNGTSMAAPHVAGAAALWVEELTWDGPREADYIRRGMERAAQPLHKSRSEEQDFGFGLVRVPDAGPVVG
jgi:hypothetical protein